MTKPKQTRSRKALFTFIANTLLLLFTVGVLEFFGWFYAERPFKSFIPSWRFNHLRKPNTVLNSREFFSSAPGLAQRFPGATWSYNNQGWLHPYDVDERKPPNTYRIFYLGDSFTEGTCPPDGNVPSVVGRRLAEMTRGGDLRFEVINTGIPSFAPTIYYIMARYKALDFDPDLMVVNVDMTDDYDEWKYRPITVVDDEGNPMAVPMRDIFSDPYIDTERGAVRATWWMRTQLYLYTKSYFFNFMLYWYAEYRDPELPDNTEDLLYPRWEWCKEEWDERVQRNVDYLLDKLRRLAELCRRNNIKLMLNAVPYYAHYHSELDGTGEPRYSARPHRELEKFAREEGIAYLNSYEALKPSVEGTPVERYYVRGDIHFNEAGYRLWADAHVRFLTDPANALLPESAYAAAR